MQRCVWVRVPSGAPQKRTRRKSCPFLWTPRAKGPLRPSGFQCSGRQSRPCAKVFTCGENACAAHLRRGPEGPFGGSSAAVPSIQNIDFNRPFHRRSKRYYACSGFFTGPHLLILLLFDYSPPPGIDLKSRPLGAAFSIPHSPGHCRRVFQSPYRSSVPRPDLQNSPWN